MHRLSLTQDITRCFNAETNGEASGGEEKVFLPRPPAERTHHFLPSAEHKHTGVREWLTLRLERVSGALLTFTLLSFIPQRYDEASDAVSCVSLLSCRHFPQSAVVH